MEEAPVCSSAALCVRCRTGSDGAYCCGASFQRRGARALRSSSVYWVTPSRCRDGQATAEDWTPRVRKPKHAIYVQIFIFDQLPTLPLPFFLILFLFDLQTTQQGSSPFTQCIRATSSCSTCPPCCPTQKRTNSRCTHLCLVVYLVVRVVAVLFSNSRLVVVS